MSLYNTICWKKTRRKKMKVSTHQELEKSGRLICTETPKERIVKRLKIIVSILMKVKILLLKDLEIVFGNH